MLFGFNVYWNLLWILRAHATFRPIYKNILFCDVPNLYIINIEVKGALVQGHYSRSRTALTNFNLRHCSLCWLGWVFSAFRPLWAQCGHCNADATLIGSIWCLFYVTSIITIVGELQLHLLSVTNDGSNRNSLLQSTIFLCFFNPRYLRELQLKMLITAYKKTIAKLLLAVSIVPSI